MARHQEDHHSEQPEPGTDPSEPEATENLNDISEDHSTASLDDAVREALSVRAREIADRIATSSSYKYSAILGSSPLLDDAVREALSGPAQRIADQIATTSLGWLRNYSGQALEPSILAEVARTLARDQLASPQSDYEPAIIESSPQDSPIEPASIFERYEITIKSFQGLTREFDRLTRRLAPLTISWRGQADADWGLHSTLYRAVPQADAFPHPNEFQDLNVRGKALPTEDDMLSAERYLLNEIADRWRLGNSPAVELLARMQHRGVPTRLLDATRSPLLALWFAVSEPRDTDARLFAIAHRPIPQSDDVRMRALWSDPHPFWFQFGSASERVVGAWGTGTRLREVAPPEYDKRILAQNAVFLLDGAPALTPSVLELFNSATSGSWTAVDIAASMSLVLAPVDPTRKSVNESDPLSLVYSFRIPKDLKQHILETLKRTYGMDWETIYPDIDGLKAYLGGTANWPTLAREAHPSDLHESPAL